VTRAGHLPVPVVRVLQQPVGARVPSLCFGVHVHDLGRVVGKLELGAHELAVDDPSRPPGVKQVAGEEGSAHVDAG